jgi:hypothetical protein
MIERVFTFGFGQVHPVTGAQLAGCYIAIRGLDEADCREQMRQKFGAGWGMEYPSRYEAGVYEFNLQEIWE